MLKQGFPVRKIETLQDLRNVGFQWLIDEARVEFADIKNLWCNEELDDFLEYFPVDNSKKKVDFLSVKILLPAENRVIVQPETVEIEQGYYDKKKLWFISKSQCGKLLRLDMSVKGIQVIEVETIDDLQYCGYDWLVQHYPLSDLKGLTFDVKYTLVRAKPIMMSIAKFGVVVDNRLYPENIKVYTSKDGLSFILEKDFDKII